MRRAQMNTMKVKLIPNPITVVTKFMPEPSILPPFLSFVSLQLFLSVTILTAATATASAAEDGCQEETGIGNWMVKTHLGFWSSFEVWQGMMTGNGERERNTWHPVFFLLEWYNLGCRYLGGGEQLPLALKVSLLLPLALRLPKISNFKRSILRFSVRRERS